MKLPVIKFSCTLFVQLEKLKAKETIKLANETESNMPFIIINPLDTYLINLSS